MNNGYSNRCMHAEFHNRFFYKSGRNVINRNPITRLKINSEKNQLLWLCNGTLQSKHKRIEIE